MSLPVLLIGFNRPDLIENQLHLLSSLGVEKIYISIDGGRDSSEQSICRLSAEAVRRFEFNGELILRTRVYNLGCGLGVISALDWFFSLEPLGIVLEDDCVPTKETLQYFERNKAKLLHEANLGMISAHNPCVEANNDIYSTYVFINGWMTTSEKYKSIRKGLFQINSPFKRFLPGGKWRINDAIFWWATSTRVKLGRHDTWDSPFLESFSSLDLRCLIPRKNLIQNVGFGISASHTKDVNGTIFIPPEQRPFEVNQSNFDSLVRKMHFKIKKRHFVTPFGRVFRDYLSQSRRDFEKILNEDRMNLTLSTIEIFK